MRSAENKCVGYLVDSSVSGHSERLHWAKSHDQNFGFELQECAVFPNS